MIRTSGRLLVASLLGSFLTLASPLARAQWTAPTPEELSMTSQPQVPGAKAVYLYREETTEDRMHAYRIYVRLKVLTESGKELGNVELQYARVHDDEGSMGFTVDDIQGRTIHPDGTIIPFTGKPYEKLVEKNQGVKVMAKVFSMPDVTVGSILEYRYKILYDDRFYDSPSWYIQSNLWTRKAHYVWKPVDLSNINLVNARGQSVSMISWSSVLPAGTSVVNTHMPGAETMELNAHDIPPAPEEDHMPPISSFTYRVMFYYTAYHSPEDFWKDEGKFWAKKWDKFIGPGPIVTAAVKDVVAPTDTPDQKLHKLYAAVMKLENTRYTRQHTGAEEKAEGFKEVHNADDIWTRKRGSDDQIAALFVSMARAAGIKAYVGIVTSRQRSIFTKTFLNLSQLNDLIAIVNIDGKEQFLDPGTRFCPYGHLAWEHTITQGIRQTDNGSSDFFATPGESYAFSRIQRIANLGLGSTGELAGTITMSYTGDPALHWRHRSLEGDSASLEREIHNSVENLMPPGVEVKVTSVDKLEDYEQPLVANLEVKGTLGSSTGKRVLLPSDIFVATAKPAFPHEKREIPVYFEYPRITQDAVRIKFAKTLAIESLPASDKGNFEKSMVYSLSTESTADSFTVRRTYALGDIVFPLPQYPAVRAFYSKMENKDQESVVLTNAAAAPKPTPTGN
jgi:Domain of Unknown Function with PDB structure (DUF3857)/Transglutaminase-like superfamily